jgi:hypothetical protein
VATEAVLEMALDAEGFAVYAVEDEAWPCCFGCWDDSDEGDCCRKAARKLERNGTDGRCDGILVDWMGEVREFRETTASRLAVVGTPRSE